MTSRRLALLLLAAGLSAAGCSGADEPEQPPADVLAEAKATLDETSGVHIELSTQSLPSGVDGIVSADGIGTHAPAFEGTLKVATGGITADVPVVAVDGAVYAKMPFTTRYTRINPAEYAAPDPGELMGTEKGLSSLLTSAEDVERGSQVRDGEQVLTEYTGTVPGDAVVTIIPSASPDSDFEATFTIDDDNVLSRAEVTGPFYPKAKSVVYTIEFDQYGTERDISAP